MRSCPVTCYCFDVALQLDGDGAFTLSGMLGRTSHGVISWVVDLIYFTYQGFSILDSGRVRYVVSELMPHGSGSVIARI